MVLNTKRLEKGMCQFVNSFSFVSSEVIIKPTKTWEEYILPLNYQQPIGTCTLKWNWKHSTTDKVPNKKKLLVKALGSTIPCFVCIPFYHFDMVITVRTLLKIC